MHLDSVIFLLFLLINLFVGIRAIRQSNIPYRHFTTAHITAAMLAITYGGEVLCTPLHMDGLLCLTGSAVSYYIVGSFLSHRLHLCLNKGSVAEIMGQFYGATIRKMVAICGILYSASAAAMQFKLLAMAISWFFGIQGDHTLLIAAYGIMFSIAPNAIQSLALVRVVRCTTFGLLLPIIAWTAWKCMINQCHVDPVNLSLAIKRSWNSFIHVHAAPLDYMLYFIAFSIPTFYPAQVASILMAKNATQIKHTFNSTGFFSLIINLLLLWVALLGENSSVTLILSAIPLSTWEAYQGLKGLFMIGIVTLTLSTAGANLHAATSLIREDLSDLFKWGKQPILYQAIVGVMATLLALYSKNQTIWMAIVLFKTVVSLPFLLSLTGIVLHPYAVLIGMLAGGLTTIAWYYFGSNVGMHSLLPAILMNLLSMLVSQFFKGKWNKDQHHLSNTLAQAAAPKPLPLWKQLSKYILQRIKLFNFWNYLEGQLPKDNLPFILFSLYLLLTGYGSFYTFCSHPAWHARLETFILFPTLFVATFFLFYTSIVPQVYIRKIASIIWPFSHIYFLFLASTGMVMLSKYVHLYNVIFILNLFLAILISPLIVILFGCIISVIMVWVARHYIDSTITLIDPLLDLNIHITYAILIVFFLVSGFLYHNTTLSKHLSMIQTLTNQREEQNARQFFNKQQVEALAYESNCIISQLNHQLIRLKEPEERHLAYSAQTIKLTEYFNSIFQHLKHNLHLVTNWISIDQLLANCFDAIKMSNIYDAPYVISNTKHFYIQCAIENIQNLIISSLYACSGDTSLHSHPKRDIYIHINDTQLAYRLTLLQGKLQKINAISFVITTATRLPKIRPTYKVPEMADIQILDGNEPNMDAAHQHIVHAHYGYHEQFCSGSDLTHLYVIPVNVKEITKAFATLSPVVYTQRMVLDPISMQEEADFLESVQQKKGLNVEAIMDALGLLKVYYTTQRRKTGELFYLHPMAVASILLTITDDANVIIAGLVHDIVQNTPFTQAGLTTLFGASITQTVWAAAHLEKALPNLKEHYASYIEEIIRDQSHNAILVRLADVLHNARTISGHTIEKQIEKAKLIQNFYLPLAIQIELTDIADELRLHSEKILKIATMVNS